ncbi:MAG: hypothetical protein PHT88_04745 [Candidatus Moranbacteria bacterium]|nr:hypothetical protein [Candidatus Moranbacteria bacterium]
MAYDNPSRMQYTIAANDFGGGADTTQIVSGPAGKRGRVKHVLIYDVTETFVGTTSGGQVLVGKSGDTDAYFVSSAPVLAGSSPAVGASVVLVNQLTPSDATEIPADTPVHITCVKTVGGTVTGIASVDVSIDWY